MRAIMHLLTSEEPLTMETDWFTLRNARLHLRPYTQPHFPLAVAAAGSPTGMLMAGKFGLEVLGISSPRGDLTLKDFWRIAEETAAENGKTVDRKNWRLVMHVHLSDTKEQALKDVSARAGVYWRDYFEGTMGFPRAFEDDQNLIAQGMHDRHAWCIGTPDDLIETIHRLDEASGGFGGILMQGVDWATREQIRHSYDLIARYVKPVFQGSLRSLQASQQDAERQADEVRALRDGATAAARQKYDESKAANQTPA